jgi:hypothetical protein
VNLLEETVKFLIKMAMICLLLGLLLGLWLSHRVDSSLGLVELERGPAEASTKWTASPYGGCC